MARSLDSLRRSGLTASGLLYEANYAEWILKINAVLHVNGLGDFGSGNSRHVNPLADHDDNTEELCIWDERNWWSTPWEYFEEPIALIISHVSPHLRTRVFDLERIDTERESPFVMLSRLAQPFVRFWDLPPELRFMIYEYALKPLGRRFAIAYNRRIYECPEDQPDWPVVLQVCRQMRQEILPLFYSKNAFYFHSTWDAYPFYDRVKGAGFGPWYEYFCFYVLKMTGADFAPIRIQEVVRHNVKYLRKVTYVCSTILGSYRIDLEWSKAKGFQFSYDPPEIHGQDPDEEAESMKENSKIMRKLTEVEQTSRLMGVKGESLVLAMMTLLRVFGHDEIDAQKYQDTRAEEVLEP